MALRLWVNLPHHGWARGEAGARGPVERVLALARVADEAGVETISVNEDLEGWDAFGVLGAIAGVTGRARLGPAVTSPYVRHPNALAAAVATLDRLSGGRAFLGLGRGQPEWLGRGLGTAVGEPAAVLEETIGLLRQWWAPPHRASSVDVDGLFRVRAWERSIGPAQGAPGPPIYLAAAGPRALALAGRVADGVIFNALTSNEFLAEAIPRVLAAARGAGRDPAGLRFILKTAATVTDEPGPLLERQKTLVALVNALPGMDRLLASAGFDVPGIMATVRQAMRTADTLAAGGGFPALRRAGDLTAARAAIPTGLVERLAIVGSVERVEERLREVAGLGVTDVAVGVPRAGEPVKALAGMVEAARGVVASLGPGD